MPIENNAERAAPAPPNDRADTITRSVRIDAPPADVWNALTNPELMKRWMSEADIEIVTDRRVGAPFIVRGDLHGTPFENAGTVLRFEPERVLRYNHLSSLSNLPDVVENYSILEFELRPVDDRTTLTLRLWNFPTESIRKHLAFYWNVALEVLKRTIEKQG